MKYSTLSVPAELLAAFKQAFPVLTMSKFVGRVIQLCLDCPEFVQFLQIACPADLEPLFVTNEGFGDVAGA